MGALLRSPAESRREPTAPKSGNAKRAPRCTGAFVFERNERHAAWERLFSHSTMNRPPSPTGPGDPKGNPRPPKATPKTEKGQRRGSTYKAPEPQNGKTGLQVMARMATDGHGVSENKAPEHQSFNTIKTAKPQILENITRESAGAEVTPSTLSGTLHGNAFFSKNDTFAADVGVTPR